jgi:hypothetical protein
MPLKTSIVSHLVFPLSTVSIVHRSAFTNHDIKPGITHATQKLSWSSVAIREEPLWRGGVISGGRFAQVSSDFG